METSADLKACLKRHEPHELLRGRSAMLIFEKQSARTRTSFQAACAHLGVRSFFTMPQQLQMGRGEPIKDTARVIDALTDMTHPCQGLAREKQSAAYPGFRRVPDQ